MISDNAERPGPQSGRVVGRIPVLEALRAGARPARRLRVLRGARGIETILQAAAGIPIEECARGELDALAGGTSHQGVVLDAAPLRVHKFEQWVRGEDRAGDAVVVLLDGVEDPHNFGAIVRSAAACGACAVLFGQHRAAPISSASMKSAAGAMEYVDLVRATNLVRAIGALQQAGFWVAGLEADGAQVLWEADLTGPVVLVVGSEGKGLRRLVREACDFHLRIPLTGPVSSLNASVSAAVALVECCRQRTLASPGGPSVAQSGQTHGHTSAP